MIITKTSSGIVIKSGRQTIDCGQAVKINDFVINEPGEYEIAGVEAGKIDGLTWLNIEGVKIGYFAAGSENITKEQVKELGGINLAVCSADGKIVNAAKKLEPQIILAAEEKLFAGEEAVKTAEFKITKNDLTEESQKIIVLL